MFSFFFFKIFQSSIMSSLFSLSLNIAAHISIKIISWVHSFSNGITSTKYSNLRNLFSKTLISSVSDPVKVVSPIANILKMTPIFLIYSLKLASTNFEVPLSSIPVSLNYSLKWLLILDLVPLKLK